MTSAPQASFAMLSGSSRSPFSIVRLFLGSSFDGSRITAVTLCPRASSSFKMRLPIMPVAPYKTTFIPFSSLYFVDTNR